MGERIFITASEVAEILEYANRDAFLRRRAELEEDHDFPPPAPLQSRPLKWRRDAVEHWKTQAGLQARDDGIRMSVDAGPIGGKVALLRAAQRP